MVMTGIDVMKQKRQQTAKVTVSGIITKAPQRVRTITGKAILMPLMWRKMIAEAPVKLSIIQLSFLKSGVTHKIS